MNSALILVENFEFNVEYMYNVYTVNIYKMTDFDIFMSQHQ